MSFCCLEFIVVVLQINQLHYYAIMLMFTNLKKNTLHCGILPCVAFS